MAVQKNNDSEGWHHASIKLLSSRKVADAILSIDVTITQRGQALLPSDQANVWKEAQKNSALELQILTKSNFLPLGE